MERDLVEQIQEAALKIKLAVDRNDSIEVVDWTLTVQIKTAELAASVITNVRNI